MSREYNVFDEWENFLGRFKPAGDPATGCAFIIAAIVVTLAGFLIYALASLIIRGIKAAINGDFGSAAANLAIPCILGIAILVHSASVASTQRAEAQQSQKVQDERQRALSNPSQAFTWERTGGDLAVIPGCHEFGIVPCDHPYAGTSRDGGASIFAQYKLTNKLQLSTLQLSPTIDDVSNISTCMTKWAMGINLNYENTVAPGESVTLYCVERYGATPVTPCVKIKLYPFDDLTSTCSSK